MGSIGSKLREIHILQSAPATNQPLTFESSKPIFDISGVLGPPLLSIINDVQTDGDLSLNYFSLYGLAFTTFNVVDDDLKIVFD